MKVLDQEKIELRKKNRWAAQLGGRKTRGERQGGILGVHLEPVSIRHWTPLARPGKRGGPTRRRLYQDSDARG